MLPQERPHLVPRVVRVLGAEIAVAAAGLSDRIELREVNIGRDAHLPYLAGNPAERIVLYIGAGGFLGAIARYAVGVWIETFWRRDFPLATFLVNVTGCFVLGLFLTLQLAKRSRRRSTGFRDEIDAIDDADNGHIDGR